MSTLGTGGPPEDIPTLPDIDFTYDQIADGEIIGQGGNADVHRASVDVNGQKISVAVKQPRLQGTIHGDTVDRFVAEAEVWEKLDDHNHVVGLYSWASDPLPWIGMEYMDGGTLEELLATEDLPVEQAVWVGLCVARAVRHAHRHGVAHHDIKPANVLFSVSDEGWMVPKVSDWGLARMMLESTSSVEGLSPQYAAPEQFDSATYGSPDDYTDIYQVGTLVYTLVTGRPPFEGSSTAVMQDVLSTEPDPPSEIADVPESVDDVVMPALRKNKTDRYDSILYLRDELEDLFTSLRDGDMADSPVSSPSTSTPESSAQPTAQTEDSTTADNKEKEVIEDSTAETVGSSRTSTADSIPLFNNRLRSAAVTGGYGLLGLLISIIPIFLMNDLPGPVMDGPMGDQQISITHTIIGNSAIAGGVIVFAAAGLRAAGKSAELQKGVAVFGACVFFAATVMIFLV